MGVRVLAVFPVDLSRTDNIGVSVKCLALLRAARASGLTVDAAFAVGNHSCVLPHDEIPGTIQDFLSVDSSPPRMRSLRARWFRYAGYWSAVSQVLSSDYAAVWVRAFPLSISQAAFLRHAARASTLVYDLPTYPTRAEASGIARLLYSFVDGARASVLRRNCSRVVTLSAHDRIAGVATLRVRNGVDQLSDALEGHTVRRTGEYVLVATGQWAHWHGLDRILHALARLRRPYRLEVYGKGPELANLKALAKRLDVRVHWHEPVVDARLSAALAEADVAIGTLGIHRKGVSPDRSLKHRTYAAHGLPFVATPLDDTWDGLAGVWQVPSTEEPIDPEGLRAFLQLSRKHRNEWRRALLERAASQTWLHTYAPLWRYFAGLGQADNE